MCCLIDYDVLLNYKAHFHFVHCKTNYTYFMNTLIITVCFVTYSIWLSENFLDNQYYTYMIYISRKFNWNVKNFKHCEPA